MNYLHRLKIFDQFNCLGSSCPQTCCANWVLPLEEKDIAYYKKNPKILGELKENFDFEQKIIKSTNKRCNNLDESGLCKLHTKSSHKALPLVCKTYPRYVIDIEHDLWYTGTLSCPEIVNLLFSHEGDLFHPKKRLTSKAKRADKNIVIRLEFIDQYMQNLSLLQQEDLRPFFIEYHKLFNTCFNQKSKNTEISLPTFSNTILYTLMYIKNLHVRELVEQTLELLEQQGLIINDQYFSDDFPMLTKQRFLDLPSDLRKKIWAFFKKTLYVGSIIFLKKQSLQVTLLWQSTYIITFLSLGIWNSNNEDIEHWKRICYQFGRISHAKIGILKMPLLETHSTTIFLLYELLKEPETA